MMSFPSHCPSRNPSEQKVNMRRGKVRSATTRLATTLGSLFFCLSLAACSSPPLRLYTLGGPSIASSAQSGSIPTGTPILEIRRVVLPDYLDTQDIVVRRGEALSRSPNGRWAERLSNGMTDFLTARLGAARSDLFVTEQSPATPASARLMITITRFDITQDGTGTLEASWALVPTDESRPEQLERGVFTVHGPARTDSEVVALMNGLISQLSEQIVARLPSKL